MAAPAVPVESSEAEEAVPVRKSKKKLFIIAGALVVLLGGGGAGAWFFMHGAHDTKEKAAEPAKPPVYLPLETFTVNLQGGEQYLQTDITLQVAEPAGTASAPCVLWAMPPSDTAMAIALRAFIVVLPKVVDDG